MTLLSAFEFNPKLMYPQLQILSRGYKWSDEFTRLTLNPTNFPVIYATAGTGTESIAIGAARRLDLVTGSSIGDDASVACNEMNATRRPNTQTEFNPRSTLRWKFAFSMGDSTDNEVFVGIANQSVPLTALPTTIGHMGIQYDDTGDPNFRTTSGNGASQVLEDTGEAGDGVIHRLEIDWTGDNAGEIRWYATASATTPQYTDTVTAMSASNLPVIPYFYVEAEGGASETLRIFEWSIEVL